MNDDAVDLTALRSEDVLRLAMSTIMSSSAAKYLTCESTQHLRSLFVSSDLFPTRDDSGSESKRCKIAFEAEENGSARIFAGMTIFWGLRAANAPRSDGSLIDREGLIIDLDLERGNLTRDERSNYKSFILRMEALEAVRDLLGVELKDLLDIERVRVTHDPASATRKTLAKAHQAGCVGLVATFSNARGRKMRSKVSLRNREPRRLLRSDVDPGGVLMNDTYFIVVDDATPPDGFRRQRSRWRWRKSDEKAFKIVVESEFAWIRRVPLDHVVRPYEHQGPGGEDLRLNREMPKAS